MFRCHRLSYSQAFIKEDYITLWVGVWSWAELLAARQLFWFDTVSAEQLLRRVGEVGQVPRNALQYAGSPVMPQAIQTAIQKCDSNLISQAVIDLAAAPGASNKLVHVVVSRVH